MRCSERGHQNDTDGVQNSGEHLDPECEIALAQTKLMNWRMYVSGGKICAIL